MFVNSPKWCVRAPYRTPFSFVFRSTEMFMFVSICFHSREFYSMCGCLSATIFGNGISLRFYDYYLNGREFLNANICHFCRIVHTK